MTLTLPVALLALLAMLLGEAWRAGVPGSLRDAPIAQASGVALALSTSWPAQAEDGLPRLLGLTGPLLLALGATLVVGILVHRDTLLPDLARSLSSVLLAGLLVRIPGPGDRSLLDRVGSPGGHAGVVAVLLLLVAAIAVVGPLLLGAAIQSLRDRGDLGARVLGVLPRSGPLPLATATLAAVMAIALPVLGPVVFILFLVPMAVLLRAVTEQRRIRAAQDQTILVLAGLTDHAGLTTDGHARRVAALALPAAMDLGVEGGDLADVEAVALLHDLGQVVLSRPIPGGATIEVSMRDQRRIAATGAAILARTAELSRLAPLVADVGVPHHRAVERGDVAPVSRLVRVASAYDDLTAGGARLLGAQGPTAALARLVRSAPHDYDPQALRALMRQLERRGDLTGPDADRLREALPPVTAPERTGPARRGP